MFLIPLNQLESVELVLHALKTAAGEADCRTCPVRKVCMKQCLSLAEAVGRMLADGTLPRLGDPAAAPPVEPPPPTGGGNRRLKVVK